MDSLRLMEGKQEANSTLHDGAGAAALLHSEGFVIGSER